ncbi:MAG TPA: ATP-binding protein [Polyangia bacterium]
MIKYTRANGCNVICLEVPGIIECRDMTLRTVSAACKLVMPEPRIRETRHSEFIMHVVSAVGEAYNNIVLHGYAGREPGTVHMQIENCSEWMRVMMKDTGVSFDPCQAIPPDLQTLPESGMGIFIMRSFVDEITYVAGPPNVLTLFKRLDGSHGSGINANFLSGPDGG